MVSNLGNIISLAQRNGANGKTDSVPETNGPPSSWILEEIGDRVNDTRPIDEGHVVELMESIAAISLIEPVVLDRNGMLLAGGHRRAALTLLKENDPERYAQHFPKNLIPCYIRDFDAKEDPNLALQIEIAENEKRRDYTNAEIKTLAERLKEAGFKTTRGKPKPGERPLLPALATIVGKSARTIQRRLAEADETGDEAVETKASPPKPSKSQEQLKKAIAALERWQTIPDKTKTEQEVALTSSISDAINILRAGLVFSAEKD